MSKMNKNQPQQSTRDWITPIVVGVLLVCGIIFSSIGYTNENRNSETPIYIIDYFSGDIGVELLSIVFTVAVIDQLNRRREKREEAARERWDERNRLVDLIPQTANELDKSRFVVQELRDREFLLDNSLQGIYLRAALLQGVNLERARLAGANLIEADLLEAKLDDAELSYARLIDTNFQGARLHRTNLQGANMSKANFNGADLLGANLTDATITSAQLNEETRLPDGKRWTPDTDMTRFINPSHPEYWRAAQAN